MASYRLESNCQKKRFNLIVNIFAAIFNLRVFRTLMGWKSRLGWWIGVLEFRLFVRPRHSFFGKSREQFAELSRQFADVRSKQDALVVTVYLMQLERLHDAAPTQIVGPAIRSGRAFARKSVSLPAYVPGM